MSVVRKLEMPTVSQPEASSNSFHLVGARTDFWLIGGASIVMFCGFHLFTATNADVYKISTIMYYLSFAVNAPHFLLSYQLLYWDQRKSALHKPSFIWAAFLAPVLLIGILAYGFAQQSNLIFSISVHAMYILVGWHYIKQVFGTMVVTSAQRKFYFNNFERWVLLANLYSLAILSWLIPQTAKDEVNFHGVKYSLLGLDVIWKNLSYGFTIVSGLAVLVLFARRFIKEGRGPAPAAWVSFLALYTWYLPFAYHPHFFYMIPFFHSAQYLLFVIALKKNQWQSEVQNFEEPKQRFTLSRNYILYFGGAALLGLLAFETIPVFLDNQYKTLNPTSESIWGPTIFMACFMLFINIHHYFIDNVIWRKTNPDLQKYLFKRPS